MVGAASSSPQVRRQPLLRAVQAAPCFSPVLLEPRHVCRASPFWGLPDCGSGGSTRTYPL